jgi:hypothetical protein
MKIIYTRSDGRVCVVHPVNPVNDVLDRVVPDDATNVTVVEDDAIPEDRSRRNEWTIVNGEIVTP